MSQRRIQLTANWWKSWTVATNTGDLLTYINLLFNSQNAKPRSCLLYKFIQREARKTGPPSRRPTWALVSDSVQEIKQMQMQSTYWLEKVLKMISLHVNALLCTLQHIVKYAKQLGGVNLKNCLVASRVWQHAAACTKVHWRTRRSFSAPSVNSKYFAFAFV